MSSSPIDSEESLLHKDEEQDYYRKNSPVSSSIYLPHRRRRFFAACAALATTSLLTLFVFHLWTNQSSVKANVASDQLTLIDPIVNASAPVVLDPLGPESLLNGPPTANFRDNLRSDVKYITSWISAGWTNDVMTYGNLIYLAIITDRVPILPMFTPSHIGGGAPSIPFGDVFDVPRLRQALGKPVIEWRDVKDPSSESVDELGCWNTWQSVQYNEDSPRYSFVPQHLKLDISYTQAPSWIKLIPNYQHDMHTTFWSLASLAFPQIRTANLVPPRESPINHVSLPPDEQVLCYDYLYYVCASQPFEYEFDYSPAWRFVGQYMYWVQPLQDLADSYVRRAIGNLTDSDPTPPWITIHMRHGDFGVFCSDVPVDCFAPLSVIARRVREVQQELLDRKGIHVTNVIMTSDERDAGWWEGVKQEGWLTLDHSKTAELYGDWYPVFIDAVIQSMGQGFVGTDRSTMSTMARRRVESWGDGAVRTVKWGSPQADDH